MIKAEEKLNEVQATVEKLKSEADKRVESLQGLISNLRGDIKAVEDEAEVAEQKTGKINNEIRLLNENIESEKKSISDLEARKKELTPDVEAKNSKEEELKSKITELEGKKTEMETQISEAKDKKAQLEAEKTEKSEALADLEGSIEKDLTKNRVELEEYKEEYNRLLENNLVWEYMFEQIETPEVEIMAIIAANRGISQDDIKSQAKNVSPVFVGRAIAKLEADGKIVQKDNVWDLSPSLIEVIDS